jgi:O-antigen ligase
VRTATTVALALFFAGVQFYTSLASLAPTPPVGYVFASRAGAAALLGLLVAAALVCLVRLVNDRLGAPPASRAALVAWIGATALAAVLGLDPASGLQVVAIMLIAAAFHVGLVRYGGQPGTLPAVLATYLATGLVAALAALGMLVLRAPAALYALNNGRAAGFFVTANQFATFLIAFVFVAAGTLFAAGGGLRRLAAAALGVGLLALVATVSLAGWLGAAVGAVFFAWSNGLRRPAAGLAVALVVVALVLESRPLAGHDRSGAFDRLRAWRAGLRVAELFPLTGAGPMAYWRVYPEVRPPNGDPPGTFGALHPHDAYLSLAGELGIVGLAGAGYGWIRLGRRLRHTLAAQEPRARRLALGVCAGLVAVLVQGLFDTIGVVDIAFVWIPYTALALAAADAVLPGEDVRT